MGDFVELRGYSVVDGTHMMAMDVAPKTGHAIEITVAVEVEKIWPFTAFDDEWVVLAPLTHGGEGVPYMRVILACETRGVRG